MLKTCENAQCAPIEQTRGDMGPGDYHDVIANNHMRAQMIGGVQDPQLYGVPQGSPEAETANPGHVVEMSEDGKTDFRICCKTCGKATPWNKADAPGMPGVGKIFTRNLWDVKL